MRGHDIQLPKVTQVQIVEPVKFLAWLRGSSSQACGRFLNAVDRPSATTLCHFLPGLLSELHTHLSVSIIIWTLRYLLSFHSGTELL